MTADIDVVPAAALPLDALAELFTRSFEQYFYPGTLSAADLATRVRVESIDLWRSVVLRVAGEPAGLALLGIRPGLAWCGGFGIVLPQRGRGLARRLAAEMIASARAAGVPLLKLEVLTRNDRAIATYASAGFRATRDLLILGWERPAPPPAPLAAPELVEVAPELLLRHFAALHPQPAAWQRTLPSLLLRGPLQGFTLGGAQPPAAYALLQPDAKRGARIADFGAARVEPGQALIAALQARFETLMTVNEPQGSPQEQALRVGGFTERDRQHELELELGAA